MFPPDAHQALAQLLASGKRRDGSPLTGDDRAALATPSGAARWMEGHMERNNQVKKTVGAMAKGKAAAVRGFKAKADAKGARVIEVDAVSAYPAPMVKAAEEEAALGKVLAPVLALLSAQELKELGELVERSKASAVELAARALKATLDGERERLAKVLPRQRLMAEEMVRSYGREIYRAVKDATDREWDWVEVNYNTRTVKAHAKHPGSSKGVVVLSVRADKGNGEELERWRDLSGSVTEKSVLACLLGFAPPAGAKPS